MDYKKLKICGFLSLSLALGAGLLINNYDQDGETRSPSLSPSLPPITSLTLEEIENFKLAEGWSLFRARDAEASIDGGPSMFSIDMSYKYTDLRHYFGPGCCDSFVTIYHQNCSTPAQNIVQTSVSGDRVYGDEFVSVSSKLTFDIPKVYGTELWSNSLDDDSGYSAAVVICARLDVLIDDITADGIKESILSIESVLTISMILGAGADGFDLVDVPTVDEKYHDEESLSPSSYPTTSPTQIPEVEVKLRLKNVMCRNIISDETNELRYAMDIFLSPHIDIVTIKVIYASEPTNCNEYNTEMKTHLHLHHLKDIRSLQNLDTFGSMIIIVILRHTAIADGTNIFDLLESIFDNSEGPATLYLREKVLFFAGTNISVERSDSDDFILHPSSSPILEVSSNPTAIINAPSVFSVLTSQPSSNEENIDMPSVRPSVLPSSQMPFGRSTIPTISENNVLPTFTSNNNTANTFEDDDVINDFLIAMIITCVGFGTGMVLVALSVRKLRADKKELYGAYYAGSNDEKPWTSLFDKHTTGEVDKNGTSPEIRQKSAVETPLTLQTIKEHSMSYDDNNGDWVYSKFMKETSFMSSVAASSTEPQQSQLPRLRIDEVTGTFMEVDSIQPSRFSSDTQNRRVRYSHDKVGETEPRKASQLLSSGDQSKASSADFQRHSALLIDERPASPIGSVDDNSVEFSSYGDGEDSSIERVLSSLENRQRDENYPFYSSDSDEESGDVALITTFGEANKMEDSQLQVSRYQLPQLPDIASLVLEPNKSDVAIMKDKDTSISAESKVECDDSTRDFQSSPEVIAPNEGHSTGTYVTDLPAPVDKEITLSVSISDAAPDLSVTQGKEALIIDSMSNDTPYLPVALKNDTVLSGKDDAFHGLEAHRISPDTIEAKEEVAVTIAQEAPIVLSQKKSPMARTNAVDNRKAMDFWTNRLLGKGMMSRTATSATLLVPSGTDDTDIPDDSDLDDGYAVVS